MDVIDIKILEKLIDKAKNDEYMLVIENAVVTINDVFNKLKYRAEKNVKSYEALDCRLRNVCEELDKWKTRAHEAEIELKQLKPCKERFMLVFNKGLKVLAERDHEKKRANKLEQQVKDLQAANNNLLKGNVIW